MKAAIEPGRDGRWLRITRDEKDATRMPIVYPKDGGKPWKNRQEYNLQRADYILGFDTVEECQAALTKVLLFDDFDMAANGWINNSAIGANTSNENSC